MLQLGFSKHSQSVLARSVWRWLPKDLVIQNWTIHMTHSTAARLRVIQNPWWMYARCSDWLNDNLGDSEKEIGDMNLSQRQIQKGADVWMMCLRTRPFAECIVSGHKLPRPKFFLPLRSRILLPRLPLLTNALHHFTSFYIILHLNILN